MFEIKFKAVRCSVGLWKDGSWPSCLSLQGLPLCLSHPDINTRFVVKRVGGGEGVHEAKQKRGVMGL